MIPLPQPFKCWGDRQMTPVGEETFSWHAKQAKHSPQWVMRINSQLQHKLYIVAIIVIIYSLELENQSTQMKLKDK